MTSGKGVERQMGEMSREKRAKWLDEEARIKAEKGFSIDEEMIRSGAAALRRLDELEKWVDRETGTGRATSAYWIGYRDAFLVVKNHLTGDMPPEETPDPNFRRRCIEAALDDEVYVVGDGKGRESS